MKITEIQQMPTCINVIPQGATGVHESCVRSYQILEKVKYLLNKKVPSEIVIELINEMELKDD